MDSTQSFIFESQSEAQTFELGKQIGLLLSAGFSIGLNGTLGSGKTRLVKAIGSGLGIDAEHIVSPTFTLCVPHQGRLRMLHVDAYRIEHQEEMDELGLDEQLEDGVVLLIEWADRVSASLPPLDLVVTADPTGDGSRKYTFTANSERAGELVSELSSRIATS